MGPNHDIITLAVSGNRRILLIGHNARGISGQFEVHPTHHLVDIAVRRVAGQGVVHAEGESESAGGAGDGEQGLGAVDVLAGAVGTHARAAQIVAGGVLHVAASIEHIVAVGQSGGVREGDFRHPLSGDQIVLEVDAFDRARNFLHTSVDQGPVVDVLDAVFAVHGIVLRIHVGVHILVEDDEDRLDLISPTDDVVALAQQLVITGERIIPTQLGGRGTGGVGARFVTSGENAVPVAHAVAGPDDDGVAVGLHGDGGEALYAGNRAVDPRLHAGVLQVSVELSHEHAGRVVIRNQIGVDLFQRMRLRSVAVPHDGEVAVGVHGDRRIQLSAVKGIAAQWDVDRVALVRLGDHQIRLLVVARDGRAEGVEAAEVNTVAVRSVAGLGVVVLIGFPDDDEVAVVVHRGLRVAGRSLPGLASARIDVRLVGRVGNEFAGRVHLELGADGDGIRLGVSRVSRVARISRVARVSRVARARVVGGGFNQRLAEAVEQAGHDVAFGDNAVGMRHVLFPSDHELRTVAGHGHRGIDLRVAGNRADARNGRLVDLELFADLLAHIVEHLAVNVVEEALRLASGGPDDDEVAVIVDRHRGIELVVGHQRVDAEGQVVVAIVDSFVQIRIADDGIAGRVVTACPHVPGAVFALRFPNHDQIAVGVHVQRSVALVAFGLAFVNQNLAGKGNGLVAATVVQPQIDAPALKVVGIVLAVAGPDDREVAVVVDGHRAGGFLFGLADSQDGAQALLGVDVVFAVDAELGAQSRGIVADVEVELVAAVSGGPGQSAGFAVTVAVELVALDVGNQIAQRQRVSARRQRRRPGVRSVAVERESRLVLAGRPVEVELDRRNRADNLDAVAHQRPVAQIQNAVNRRAAVTVDHNLLGGKLFVEEQLDLIRGGIQNSAFQDDDGLGSERVNRQNARHQRTDHVGCFHVLIAGEFVDTGRGGVDLPLGIEAQSGPGDDEVAFGVAADGRLPLVADGLAVDARLRA